MAARGKWPEAAITGVDREDVLAGEAVQRTFTVTSPDPTATREADILVLAAPVGAIVEFIGRHRAQLSHHQLILDAGSTKRAVMRAARDAGLGNFVGGHPMAGAESSGPGAARADLFHQRFWFLIGDAHSGSMAVALEFVRALGAHAIVMSDDGSEHDRAMAAVSHLPQLVASLLMKRVGATAGPHLRFAGSGLHDTTRLAASAASMWESVLASNADVIRPLLTQLADDLKEIAGQLEDPDAIRELFDTANRFKRLLSSS